MIAYLYRKRPATKNPRVNELAERYINPFSNTFSENMSSVRIRVRIGANEIEIEAPKEDMREVIGYIPEVVERLPHGRERAEKGEATPSVEIPEIRIEKGDSLSTMILKMFSSEWGRKPRRLGEVRKALESYGQIYPKQSVAVSLLRLAKSGKLRRFKEGGEYVYTASPYLSEVAP